METYEAIKTIWANTDCTEVAIRLENPLSDETLEGLVTSAAAEGLFTITIVPLLNAVLIVAG